MIQQEKIIKKYVDGIKNHLHLPLNMKARIISDLATDIHARMEKGETIEEILTVMGTPKEVAAGFNTELAEYTRSKGSPWRFLFLGGAIFTGVFLIFSIISFLAQPELAYGIIGSADGPTSIYVGSRAVLPALWVVVPFFIGCLTTYLLLKWQKNGTKKQYTAVMILSIVALAFFTGDLIRESLSSYLETKDIIQTYEGNIGTAILLQAMYAIILPSFWLPIVTLIVSIRKRKNAVA